MPERHFPRRPGDFEKLGGAIGMGGSVTVAREGVERPDGMPFVMLVEDDPATGLMYRVGLEVAGFEVQVFGTASAFFEALEDDVPDVAIVDFELPGIITGVQIIENLRLDDRMAELPVFVLSNHLGDFDGQMQRALEAGAMDWLVKSRTTPADLASRLDQLVRHRAADHSVA
jgi:two-component system, OmpR family, phosphate regulon response regulator PhoB